jgi:hypothetical protein
VIGPPAEVSLDAGRLLIIEIEPGGAPDDEEGGP